jgi:hypothetical protein
MDTQTYRYALQSIYRQINFYALFDTFHFNMFASLTLFIKDNLKTYLFMKKKVSL